jgi:hypothetical protein
LEGRDGKGWRTTRAKLSLAAGETIEARLANFNKRGRTRERARILAVKLCLVNKSSRPDSQPLGKIVYELRVSHLPQRLMDPVFPFPSYIYGYPSDTLSRDAIATTSCITICCIAFSTPKKVASSIESWIQCSGVALASSSLGRYGTHLCTAVMPRLTQAHHQFPRLAPGCEVLVSLISTHNAVSWYS